METTALIICMACCALVLIAFCIMFFLMLVLFIHMNKIRADLRIILLTGSPEEAKAKLREWTNTH